MTRISSEMLSLDHSTPDAGKKLGRKAANPLTIGAEEVTAGRVSPALQAIYPGKNDPEMELADSYCIAKP
jgi:hypothetical protein